MSIPLHWHTEPLLLLLVVGACWAHALMCGPFRERFLPGRTEYPVWHAVRFHLGVLVAYVAVGSPLDQMGESFLFWAHMLQHMLLIYISAPLIVTGLPPEFIDGYLLGGRPRLARALRVLTHPITGEAIRNSAPVPAFEVSQDASAVTLKAAEGATPAVVIAYGKFIQTIIDFTIVAFAIFMGVKAINRLKREEAVAPTAPPAPTPDQVLLGEIRDLLKAQQGKE